MRDCVPSTRGQDALCGVGQLTTDPSSLPPVPGAQPLYQPVLLGDPCGQDASVQQEGWKDDDSGEVRIARHCRFDDDVPMREFVPDLLRQTSSRVLGQAPPMNENVEPCHWTILEGVPTAICEGAYSFPHHRIAA